MQLNFAAREVAIKLVYYGPALSGKTTNLKALHELTKADSRGRLMTLETKDDRTLFFDMLPLVFKADTEGGAMSLRVKVFTVPGQVVHASTRRLVLQGADAVAFIADSQIAETENNAASFLDLRTNLKESERQFLNEKLLKASRDKIVFVITKWDILNEDEKKEALAYARTQLANLVKDPVVFPISAETALGPHGSVGAGQAGGGMAKSGMPELLAHLTTFLAEERGRILLDNALGEGVNVGNLLTKGVDARRRSLSMKTEELERRIKTLEEDLKGTAGTIEQRRMKIREEISGIKVGAQKDLERFVEDTIRQLPNVIESAKQEDLRRFLPSFLEDTFRQWAEAESKEIAAKLEQLAEKTIALIKEDAHDATKRVGEALGGDVRKLDIQVDTFRYDAGIAAVLVLGLGMMFVNVMVGGLLTIAAPIMALVLRDRIDAEYKKRAVEQAPEVLRTAAKQVGPKIDEMIEDFAKKLDTWVVTAGEELYREVLEVLNASRDARAMADHDEAKAIAEVEAQDGRLETAKKRVVDLRAQLWAPKDKVRVAESQVALTDG